ncbi:MAG: protease inhibitor I42 family protein [Hyphomonas sp.]|uniref:protease inhibitor I42 family protein n=1 Tax=Hyphomonas sp. TaxID=87 RepID=UPI0017A06936|nr:protease inhibitor I42 family protein [Hyphomonas sp.]MBU3922232.1 protease inhibitor I42 family protein [Alphaproteobacteria bacterium]MBA3069025.1 protease inhibitor I42 family protein [Hyphomonas sp.]MBU4061658.1 protease inhibitor I42 family protein [Alphaproteobacteria bacterium]MBU4163503.1 protease inhibitor I42 family protein [Alphaproteobacteria bacterium]MBU4567586.1 protease inhibitor I42 family protein [Alphaproteobacteria bacterium]
MRLLIVTAAALALGACGYFNPSADAPVVPPEASPPPAGETSDWQEPVMPTPAEAARAAEEAQNKAEAGVVYVGADKKDTTVTMKIGETLRIELVSIPTAGYVWNLVETPAFMEPAGEGTRATDPAHQEMAGFTGGNHFLSFDFIPKAAGTGTFKLTEGRPWETDEEPMDRFEVTVTVTPAE